MRAVLIWAFRLACLAGPAVQAAGLPPVDAELHHEQWEISRSGVTKSFRYDERLIRRDGHLWSERLLPAALSRLPRLSEAGGHKEFDLDGTSRHVSLDAAGQVQVEFVSRERDLVVSVSPAEYESVAFVTSYAAAAALIDPAAVARMQPMKRASSVAGAHWREHLEAERYTRVLWSDALQIALVLESGNTAGTQMARTVLKLLPKTPDLRLPWLGIERLPQKDYADFSD